MVHKQDSQLSIYHIESTGFSFSIIMISLSTLKIEILYLDLNTKCHGHFFPAVCTHFKGLIDI